MFASNGDRKKTICQQIASVSRLTFPEWRSTLTTQKIKFLRERKKTHGDILILHKYIKNHDHMLYCSWDMTCDGCNCYFSFWDICCPFTPLTAQKIFKKVKIMPEDIIILHKCTKNHDHLLYYSWDMASDGCNCYFLILGCFLPFPPLTV